MIRNLKSYFHRGSTIPLLGKTIPEHFADIVEKFPEHEAVVSVPQRKRQTYAELAKSVDHIARGLLGIGFSKGDRIGIWSTNNMEWLLLQIATASIGALLVSINPAYRPKELAYSLKRSKVQGLITIPTFRTSDYIAMLADMIPDLKKDSSAEFMSNEFPDLRRIVLYEPSNPSKTYRPYPGFTTWNDLLSAADSISISELEATRNHLDMDDPINIHYTSGTTGFPKAVILSHHNILNNAYFSAHYMQFTEEDRLCVPVPFYHCFGIVLANLLCLTCGACIVIPCEHFDALSVLDAVDTEKCTAIHGVPTMFIAELEHPKFKEFDLSTLRTGIMAGAPCPPVLVKRVMEEMNCTCILIGYGQTEASPLTHLTTRDDSIKHRIESVGRNLPHQEVKVVDVHTGEILPLGNVGEICFRGYHIMKGYYGDLEATNQVIDENGWLHSGDIGIMNANGFIQITGRLKEMIIRGGENIYPREIEDFIFTHPKVAEVAVFGIPDDYYGEEVMAWIQLHSGETATDNEIRDFCKSNIAHFKIPKYIWFVKEFPITVTGKLQKFRMREMAVEKIRI